MDSFGSIAWSSVGKKVITGITGLGLVGFVMGPDAVMFKWLGQLFLRALKMIIVPLITSSIIVGIAGILTPKNALAREKRSEQVDPVRQIDSAVQVRVASSSRWTRSTETSLPSSATV